MDIYSVLTLIAGLAFFLYGMNVMSGGLEKLSGGNLERILERMTSSIWRSIVLGAGITIAIQSSSAMTVMLVGLVNSGIMKLGQTIGVIMGSNIGTTVTTWIFTLNDIGDNGWVGLLKPENFSAIFAIVGAFLIMMSKKRRRRDIGNILIGFAVLIFGMKLMGDSVNGLEESPAFRHLLTAFENPIVGVLVSTAITGVIQSSAASIGILQTLSRTGMISFNMAIPLILGANIGTCATALLSSIGVNKNARRVAVVHTLIKVIGTIIFLLILIFVPMLIDLDGFLGSAIDTRGIAAVHTFFNVVTTILMIPFTKQLERLGNLLVRDDGENKEEFTLIDERLLSTPSFAISECCRAAQRMSRLAEKSALESLSLYDKYDADTVETLRTREDEIDILEDKLGSYLVKVSGADLTETEADSVTNLLTSLGDFERIGDHAINIMKGAEELAGKSAAFSEAAKNDLAVIRDAIAEIMSITCDAFESGNIATAMKVEPLEEVIDGLVSKAKHRHIERLKSGKCTIEIGFIMSDIITNCERIGDHCSNVAGALIELDSHTLDVHRYLNSLKSRGTPQYEEDLKIYSEKYVLR